MAWGGKAWGGYKCRETPALPPRLSSSLLAVQRHEGGGTARPLCRGRGLCPQRSHSLALIPGTLPGTEAWALWPGSAVGCRRGVPRVGKGLWLFLTSQLCEHSHGKGREEGGQGSMGASSNGGTTAPQ